MAVHYYNLALEVTRRCNMQCKHCLRGDAQDADMSFDTIDAALNGVTSIDCLTLTGGEPTLNISAMQHALDYCKQHDILLYGFFIATNGKIVTDEFMHFILDLYLYCCHCDPCLFEEDWRCTVALSQDDFHDKIPDENIWKLKALSVYSDMKAIKYRKSNEANYNATMLIDRGRASSLSGYEKLKRPIVTEFEVERNQNGSYNIDDTVLITVNGNVIPDCDYSYGMEDDISIGNVHQNTPTEIFDKYLNDSENVA